MDDQNTQNISSGSEMILDEETGITILNDTTIPDEKVWSAIQEQQPEIAALARWGSNVTSPSRLGSIFDRDRYVTPNSIFDQFKVALDAAESDDVVANFVETTESLAFNSIRVEAENQFEEKLWNTILSDIEFEERFSEMWREAVIISQFYCAVFWGRKTFDIEVRNKSGRKIKKRYNKLLVPLALSVLDPIRVVPVRMTMFGGERLAYIATRDEAPGIDDVLAGQNTADLTVSRLIESKYMPDRVERQRLRDITGTNVDNLYLLREDSVFRYTATKPGYQRFAAARMKSVFELLDLKQQLRQMDRSYLIGGTNFILLVKKGTDSLPAKQSEITRLSSQVKASARVPVIVGDHRISVEIITPKMDLTLKPERYNVLDSRLTSRLYQIFNTGNYASGTKGDDSLKLSRVISVGIEHKRRAIARSLQKNIINRCTEKNPELREEPKLVFSPKRVSLAFDQNLASYIQGLRDRGDISRATILDEVGIDQDEEAKKRRLEQEQGYDNLFTSPNLDLPSVRGQILGGNKSGGGFNEKSPATTNPEGINDNS